MQETFITGYQWSPKDGQYIGEYSFPDNQDKEDIHMPPYTTLEKPPDAPEGSCPYWLDGKWVIDKDPWQVKSKPPIDDYSMLMPDYFLYLKKEGLWTEEDQQKLDQTMLKDDAA